MGQYIFRFPKGTPELTYAGLWLYLRGKRGRRDETSRKIGTTVTVTKKPGEKRLLFWLYDLLIADIGEGDVTFLPMGDDGHMTTTEWIAAIARHNGIAGATGRRRRLKSDGLGPYIARGMAGVLIFYGTGETAEVVGQTYLVQPKNREHTLTWYERKELLDARG